VGGWRRLHNEEFYNLYIHQILLGYSSRGEWEEAGHVACMRKMRNAYRSENQKRKDHAEDLDVGGKIILEWILGWEGVDWMYVAQDRD
jgi:hypothetical protein